MECAERRSGPRQPSLPPSYLPSVTCELGGSGPAEGAGLTSTGNKSGALGTRSLGLGYISMCKVAYRLNLKVQV